MSDLSKEFPKIAALLAEFAPDSRSKQWWDVRHLELLAKEVTTLLARAPRAPERRLRSVHVPPKNENGVPCEYRYANGQFEYRPLVGNHSWGRAQAIPTAHVDAIYALKSDPYEAVESVEDVLREAMISCYRCGGATLPEMVAKYITRLRAARDAELAAAAAGGAR